MPIIIVTVVVEGCFSHCVIVTVTSFGAVAFVVNIVGKQHFNVRWSGDLRVVFVSVGNASKHRLQSLVVQRGFLHTNASSL